MIELGKKIIDAGMIDLLVLFVIIIVLALSSLVGYLLFKSTEEK